MPARKSESPTIVHQPGAQLYRRFVEGIKVRIRTAQLKAALAANAELVPHYWEIGRETANPSLGRSVDRSQLLGKGRSF